LVLMGAGDWWHLRSDASGNWWPVGRYDGTTLGRVVFETSSTVMPGGYGVLNGYLFNRTEWPWVWDHAQASGMLTTEALRAGKEGMWTSGDGATTFRSPEARGEFVRVLDELRAVDASRAAGSWQAGQIESHNHSTPGAGSFGTQMMGGGSNNYSLWQAGATGFSGGSETRPRNIAFPGRIKLI
jgi:phage-related tail fiber protein